MKVELEQVKKDALMFPSEHFRQVDSKDSLHISFFKINWFLAVNGC